MLNAASSLRFFHSIVRSVVPYFDIFPAGSSRVRSAVPFFDIFPAGSSRVRSAAPLFDIFPAGSSRVRSAAPFFQRHGDVLRRRAASASPHFEKSTSSIS
jgi:hypothetical protein